MKNSEICSKCGSHNVKKIDGDMLAHSNGDNVLIGSALFSIIKVNRYICCDCGFVEHWIDKENLEKIKDSK